jgi:hypothetical protein
VTHNPPNIGFTVDESLADIGALACFVSGQNPVHVELLGERRVELRMTRPLQRGRSRVNCTLPGPDRRWRWLGMQYLVP